MIQQRIPAARASLPLTAAWPTIKQDSQFVAASLFYQRAENILTVARLRQGRRDHAPHGRS